MRGGRAGPLQIRISLLFYLHKIIPGISHPHNLRPISALQYMLSAPRNQLLDELCHLFLNSQNQIAVRFEADIASLLSRSTQEVQMFRLSPSHYLDKLTMDLNKGLSKHISQLDGTQKDKMELNRRLECVHILMTAIPFTKNIYKKFSEINSDHIRSWVILTGTVIQCTEKKTLEKLKSFACTVCGKSYERRNTYQNEYNFEMPQQCTNMVQKERSNSIISQLYSNFYKKKSEGKTKQAPQHKIAACGNKKFVPVEQGKLCIDYQELRVQEQFHNISSGKIPQTLIVLIEGDMTGSMIFRPGDDVTITGLLSYRYKKFRLDYSIFPQLVLIANHVSLERSRATIDKTEQDEQTQATESSFNKIYANFPMNYYAEYNLTSKQRVIIKQLEFRREIIKNFCPSIYGRDMVKLGLILSLLGGVSIENESTKVRGNSHVLMVGQPGTGKSVLLKEVLRLADRSFFTNGIGTSSAGLSVSYTKEGGQWMIEAGALVLADNGICCIDELTLLSKNDEKCLLECMEQQTISSAKASIMGKFNARTTVIGACNPIRAGQKYDQQVDLQANTGLMVPLLTRFDMIFIMKDERELAEDAEKCDHVLSKFLSPNSNLFEPTETKKEQNINLKSLIRRCKALNPELSSHEILTIYYTEQRRKEEKIKTARAFESLCRIAEAHAKLMLRERTTLLDCVTAITLCENNYFSTIEEYYGFLDEFNQKYKTNIS